MIYYVALERGANPFMWCRGFGKGQDSPRIIMNWVSDCIEKVGVSDTATLEIYRLDTEREDISEPMRLIQILQNDTLMRHRNAPRPSSMRGRHI